MTGEKMIGLSDARRLEIMESLAQWKAERNRMGLPSKEDMKVRMTIWGYPIVFVDGPDLDRGVTPRCL